MHKYKTFCTNVEVKNKFLNVIILYYTVKNV